MSNYKLNIIVLLLMTGASPSVYSSSSLTINGGEGAINPMTNLSIAGATNRTSASTYTLQFRASCFATNLRGIANPVSPNSNITMTGKIEIDNSAEQSFSITFPARAVIENNATNGTLTGFTLPAGGKAAFSGNTILAELQGSSSSSINPVTAEITTTQSRFKIKDIQFTQSVPTPSGPSSNLCFNDGCSYYANSGILSSSAINVTQSSDGKKIDIETSFPGEEGYCGGYHSPLMVFLDEKIPKFDNVTNFNMGNGLSTAWPEKNHPGYFLALPNKQGKVTSKNDLFGESDKFHNGFEKLAVHDSNKDGVIDAKDPVYKKLVLWKDKTGKGVYSRNHSVPLAKFIKSINLKFQPNIMQVSSNVELREKSTIVLNEPAKYPKAFIVDVWFKPVINTDKAAHQLTSN